MSEGRFMPIPPGAIITGALPKFKIYILTQGRYVLWALDGKKVSEAQLARITESGLKEVYVDIEENIKYEEYLESNLGNILENQWSTDDQKAAIFSKVSTNVVKTAFETSFSSRVMNAEALQRTQNLVKNALAFITEAKSLPALAKMIGHDYQTYEHATKVLWFTVAFLRDNQDIMERIQPDYQTFNENQKTEMACQCGVGALLHDIGKAFVSPEILNKNDILTEIEWEIMKRHPLSSLAMLLDTHIPVFVKKAVLHHHEDFCGGGYPMGMEGLEIPIMARLLRIIDCFDAMTSRRPYKDPMPPMKAAKIMIGTPVTSDADDGSAQNDRDQGMRQCFDDELLRKFIVFLGNVKLNE